MAEHNKDGRRTPVAARTDNAPPRPADLGRQDGDEAASLSGHDRVAPDSFVVYPRNYDLIPYRDRHSWALTVSNGHAWGWRITPGLGRTSGDMVLDRAGQRVFESREDDTNQQRRWSMEEALAIALDVVDDKHEVGGMTAAQAVADRDRILASFERPAPGTGTESDDG